MIHTVTVATHSERYLPVLEQMVTDKNKGNTLNKLGYGKKYSGHYMKDLEMIEFLKDKPDDDLVVFVDGFDTLMLSESDEVIEKFKKMDKKMIVSVENVRNSFMTHSYQFRKVDEKFINTGLYMGYCGYVLKFLQAMYSDGYDKKSNQTTWSYFLNNSPESIDLSDFGLDKKSELFLNHSFTCNNKFKMDKKLKRLILNTGEKPCFIQGNGVVNMNDIIETTGYKKYNIYGKNLFFEQVKYTYNAVMNTYPVLKFFILGIILLLTIFSLLTYHGFKNKKIRNVNFVFS